MPRDKNARNAKRNSRLDHQKGLRMQYEKERRRILATQTVCGICGQPVDKNLPPGDPLAPTVDHIVPISRGGSPIDPDNLQLAHNICNRQKANKLFPKTADNRSAAESNRDLPLSFDWIHYRANSGDDADS